MTELHAHATPGHARSRKHGHSHSHSHSHKHSSEPAFQVICLASGGGPSESNVTGFLVRSIAKNWSKDSVLAVDAGSHLSAIIKLLEPQYPLVSEQPSHGHPNHTNLSGSPERVDDNSSETSESSSSYSTPELQTSICPKGPFAGVPFPHDSARANALHVVRECISTYLITHPHLDHLSGFVINTAAFHNTTRPKKLAALPSTVNAIKTHIFNDIIWPNLTDEDGGVGFVTFQRLAQGGNIAVGEGSGKGYIEVCDGLCVKGLKISHGHCSRSFDHLPHRGSDFGLSDASMYKGNANTNNMESPNRVRRDSSLHLSHQISYQLGQPGTPMSAAAAAAAVQQQQQQPTQQPPTQLQHSNSFPPDTSHTRELVVDSTAYFIRDDATRRELLFFGDVEPDAVSLHPRTLQVWTEAAPKIAHKNLRAIMIECSYDDSQADDILFGHLAPRHLVRELQVLAELVKAKRLEDKARKESKKRKFTYAVGMTGDSEYTDMSGPPSDDDLYSRHHKKRTTKHPHSHTHSHPNINPRSDGTPSAHPPLVESPSPTSPAAPQTGESKRPPLAGVTVVVIHVKDTLRDGPVIGERILHQLREHEASLKEADGIGLGCEFVISEAGSSYWF